MNTPQGSNSIYEFTHLRVSKTDFDKLVFMNPPEGKDKWHNSTLEGLCVRPLNEVAGEAIRLSGARKADGATKIFENLDIGSHDDAPESWFTKHAEICRHFRKSYMPPIWIRNLGKHDGKLVSRPIAQDSACKYFIDDGNTRALVYAVRLACGEERYEPIKAIHATSWDFTMGILGHQPQLASELYYEGELQSNLSPDTKIGKRIRWNRMTNKFT